MLAASFSKSIDCEGRQLASVRVGCIPDNSGTPDRYVTVTDDGETIFRIEVFAYRPDCFAFEEVVIWRGIVIVGFGSHIHAVVAADRSVVTIELGSYFGHFYPTSDYVLVASGERLFRLEPDRSILWKSEVLAIDGVVVHEHGLDIIQGEGEWDPPGGWQPFAVSATKGTLLRLPFHP